jgi:hypothetical protein
MGGGTMKPLVLTIDPSLSRGGFADIALWSRFFRFSWGPPPSQDELTAHLGPRTPSRDDIDVMHWSEWAHSWKHSANRKHRDLSLADFGQHYETVELWFDFDPESQLQLIWLLDYFRAYPEAAARLRLRLVDRAILGIGPDGIGDWRPPIVDVTEKELAMAQVAWQAYRSPTPEACVDLLQGDLSALPLLKPVLDLLAELPSALTGLGATEMRMLEMIGRGYSRPNDLFHGGDVRQTRVFNEFELGYLLDGLAFGPAPAVAGLDEELRTMRRDNFRDRGRAYKRSRLSLTDFGKAVVAHKEDFSRHNPIDRWWGGTHLTNDNLWRWNPALVKP